MFVGGNIVDGNGIPFGCQASNDSFAAERKLSVSTGIRIILGSELHNGKVPSCVCLVPEYLPAGMTSPWACHRIGAHTKTSYVRNLMPRHEQQQQRPAVFELTHAVE
jgi:hypothetical protein